MVARPGHGPQHPDWVLAALRRKQLAIGGGGVHRVGRNTRALIHTYGSDEPGPGGGRRRGGKGGRPASASTAASSSSSSSSSQVTAKGRPWDMYDKEEQYHRILTLRSRVTTQESEIKTLRLKLVKSQREQAKTERNVEKSISRAARVMAAMTSPAAGGGGGRGDAGSMLGLDQHGVGASEQRILNRLRAQIRQLNEELAARDKKIMALKRATHYARVTELQVELDEYRNECFRLKDVLEQVLRLEQQQKRAERALRRQEQRRGQYDDDEPGEGVGGRLGEDDQEEEEEEAETEERVEDLEGGGPRRYVHDDDRRQQQQQQQQQDNDEDDDDDDVDDFIAEGDMKPASDAGSYGYADDFEDATAAGAAGSPPPPPRTKTRRSGNGRARPATSSSSASSSNTLGGLSRSRQKRRKGKGSSFIQKQHSRKARAAKRHGAAQQREYQSTLNALATTLAALLPPDRGSAVAYARFVQNVALDLDAQHDLRSKIKSRAGVSVVPVSEFCASLGRVAARDAAADDDVSGSAAPDVPEDIIQRLLDRLGATRVKVRQRGGGDSDADANDEEYVLDYTRVVGDLLTRVDIWSLFSATEGSVSVLPDQIATVVNAQQSRIQAQQSQINTLLEEARVRSVRERELNKEIEALTRPGGRGSLLRHRQQRNSNEDDSGDDNVYSSGDDGGMRGPSRSERRTTAEAHAARERLYGGVGGGGGNVTADGNKSRPDKDNDDNGFDDNWDQDLPKKSFRRPASASRKRPQSASRTRRPMSSGRAQSASARMGAIAEEGEPGMAQRAPVSSPVRNKKILNNVASKSNPKNKATSQSTQRSSTNKSSKASAAACSPTATKPGSSGRTSPTSPKSPKSPGSITAVDTRALSASASKKSAVRREKLLLRRQQLLDERARQLSDVQIKREKRSAEDAEKRKQRELRMQHIGKTTAAVKEAKMEEELLAMTTRSPQKYASGKSSEGASSIRVQEHTDRLASSSFHSSSSSSSVPSGSRTARVASNNRDDEVDETERLKEDIKQAVNEAVAEKKRKTTLTMTKREMVELESRFRSIIRRSVSTGAFLNQSFTESDGSLNIEAFTQNIIENDHLEGTRSESSGTQYEKLTKPEVTWFLSLIDANGDGRVDYREFLHFTYNTTSSVLAQSEEGAPMDGDASNVADSVDADNLVYQVDAFAKELSSVFSNVVRSGKVRDFRDIFRTMDDDSSGSVSHEEFVQALKDFDFTVPPNVEKELLRRFDNDGDGAVNYLEFVNFCLAYAQVDGTDESNNGMTDAQRSGDGGGLASCSGSAQSMKRTSVVNQVRLALCRFVESHGSSTSLFAVFQKLNRDNPGLGVTVQAWVRCLIVCASCFGSFRIFFLKTHHSKSSRTHTYTLFSQFPPA
jgi:Ca2+-binding EF-hand superfamily protein